MSHAHAIFIALLVALMPAGAAAADAAVDKLPDTPEAWLVRMLDARQNGVAFKNPAAFAEWLDAITEPRFMTALAAVAIDPATYPKAMANAVDPAAVRNWAEFTDPQLYLRWALASASPSFQQAIVSRMTDPAKVKRWVEAMSRPDFGSRMSASPVNATLAWRQVPVPMTGPAQPGTPMTWFGAMSAAMGQQPERQEWLKLPAAATGMHYRY